MKPENWNEVIESCYDGIYRFAVHYLGSAAEAEDATQEVFLKALKAVRSGRISTIDKAWLYTIARNACLDRRRWWKRWRFKPISDEIEAHAPSAPDSAVFLIRQLRRLPLRQREVFILRHWHEFSTEECARLLGISGGAVKSHLSRAISTLKKELKKEGIFEGADNRPDEADVLSVRR